MIADLKPYPEYKESGQAWCGRVPRHWSVVPNRALFAEISDREHPHEEMLSVTITKGIIRQKVLLSDSSKKDSSKQDKSAYKLVQPRDIAYNKMRAWQGAIGASDLRGIVSPAYIVMRLRKQEDLPRYFHNLYRTPHFAKEAERWSYGITSDMWSLRPEHFKMIYTPQPPPAEQTAIVRFLDWANGRLEKAIRAKRKVIALLNEQKQAIIHRAVTRGLDPNVPLKDSGIPWLGEIPRHWECTAVWQLFEIGRGKVTSHQYIGDHPGPYPLYSSQTENEGVMGLIDSYMFDGDYLTWTTDGAHAGTVFRRSGKFSCTNVCGTLRSKRRCDLDFMRMSVASETKRHVRIDINPKLMNNMMARIRVVVPPYEEQVEIATYVRQTLKPSEQTISRLEREIALLREYCTRLVADVVTGKLDVREAAKGLPEERQEEDKPDESTLPDESDLA